MDYWVFININITSALGFSIVETKLRKKKTMITRSFSCVLVCLRWRISWSRQMKRRLTRHLGGIAGYFLFILRVLLDMECYEWIVFLSGLIFLYWMMYYYCVLAVAVEWNDLSPIEIDWRLLGLDVSSMALENVERMVVADEAELDERWITGIREWSVLKCSRNVSSGARLGV